MRSLYLKSTEDTPEIYFNVEEDKYVISGRSLPENVIEFYKPVFLWLDDFNKFPMDTSEAVFIFKLYYFNTASSKVVQDLIVYLDKLYRNGKHVKIMWYFDTDDEDIIDSGNEFQEMVSLPFEMLPY